MNTDGAIKAPYSATFSADTDGTALSLSTIGISEIGQASGLWVIVIRADGGPIKIGKASDTAANIALRLTDGQQVTLPGYVRRSDIAGWAVYSESGTVNARVSAAQVVV